MVFENITVVIPIREKQDIADTPLLSFGDVSLLFDDYRFMKELLSYYLSHGGDLGHDYPKSMINEHRNRSKSTRKCSVSLKVVSYNDYLIREEFSTLNMLLSLLFEII